jgi:hypothetical protein
MQLIKRARSCGNNYPRVRLASGGVGNSENLPLFAEPFSLDGPQPVSRTDHKFNLRVSLSQYLTHWADVLVEECDSDSAAGCFMY